jgi:DNA-binding MarR family transcriptional regulator
VARLPHARLAFALRRCATPDGDDRRLVVVCRIYCIGAASGRMSRHYAGPGSVESPQDAAIPTMPGGGTSCDDRMVPRATTVNPARSTHASEVIDGLLAVSRVLVALTAQSMAQLDAEVTLVQYRALVILADGPCRSGDLAAELGIAPSTATRLCDRMVARDLMRRFRRASDRRASWLALTPRGRDLVGAIMRQRRAAIARYARRIPPENSEALSKLLLAFLEAAGEVPQSEWWRRWRQSDRIPADAVSA